MTDGVVNPTIVGVACIYGTTVWTLPKPYRHHDVIAKHYQYTGLRGSGEQGFIDSDGQFWGRKHAMYIARSAGQLIQRQGQEGERGDLFSEDVW